MSTEAALYCHRAPEMQSSGLLTLVLLPIDSSIHPPLPVTSCKILVKVNRLLVGGFLTLNACHDSRWCGEWASIKTSKCPKALAFVCTNGLVPKEHCMLPTVGIGEKNILEQNWPIQKID